MKVYKICYTIRSQYMGTYSDFYCILKNYSSFKMARMALARHLKVKLGDIPFDNPKKKELKYFHHKFLFFRKHDEICEHGIVRLKMNSFNPISFEEYDNIGEKTYYIYEEEDL